MRKAWALDKKAGQEKSRILLSGPGLLFCFLLLCPWRPFGLTPEDLLAVSAGPVVLKPTLSFGEAFTDNANRGDGKRIPRLSEWITFVMPGLRAESGAPGGPVQLQLAYSARTLFYARYDEYNATDHSVSGSVGLFGARIRSSTTGSATFASSISTGLEEFFYLEYLVRTRTTRNIYSLNEQVSLDVSPKTDLHAGFQYNGTDYSGKTLYYDYSRYQASGGIGYAIGVKHTLSFDLYYAHDARSGRRGHWPDLEIYGGTVGLSGEITPKVTGSIRVGYEVGEFEDGTDAQTTPSVDVNLTWKPRDRTTVTVSFARAGRASVYYAKSAYVTTYGAVSITEIVGVRYPVSLQLTGRYGVHEYQGKEDTSGSYANVSLGASYPIKRWWRIGCFYEYERRDGTGRDYDAHQVVISTYFGL